MTHVRNAYRRLQELTQAAPTPAQIRVGRFVEGRTADIADREYADLVTVDTGFTTELTTHSRTEDTDAKDAKVVYELVLKRVSLNLANLPRYSVADVWREAQVDRAQTRSRNARAPEREPLPEPVSVSTFDRYVRFRVTVTLGDRVVRYWTLAFERSDPSAHAIVIVDPVLWMVNKASLEKGTAASAVDVESVRPGSTSAAPVATASSSESGLPRSVLAKGGRA